MATTRVHERDLTAYLRGSVDACFEENQYEAGLATLDQIREAIYKPAPAHIRQLVCIALGVPPPTQKDTGASQKNDKNKRVDPDFQPPVAINQQKYSPLPSREATKLARKLLISFALTNSPASLLCALPRYPLDSNLSDIRGRVDGEGLLYDGEDSFIAKVAQCVGTATNVWELLKPGFVKWEDYASNGVANMAKGKRRSARVKEEFTDDFLDGKEPAAVGEEAWSVLDWLILVFDKDERRTVEDGQPCYSPLLLSTIPSTRSKDPRWDARAVLDVVSQCLDDQDEIRRTAGMRLLHQLINLTCTTLFDLQQLVGALHGRLPIADWDQFGPYLTNLPATAHVLHFKLLLCMRYLNEIANTGSRRPAPAKRAQPRARGARDQVVTAAEATGAARSISRTYTLPSWIVHIEPLLSAPLPSISHAIFYTKIKFELLSAYAALQGLQVTAERDTAWDESLADGALRSIIQNAFGAVGRDKLERRDSQVLGELLVSLIPSFQIAVN